MNDERFQDDDAIDMIKVIASMPAVGRALHQQRVWAFVEGARSSLEPSAFQLLDAVVTMRPGATMLESQLTRYADRWRGLERDLLTLGDCFSQWNANIAKTENIFSRPPKDLPVLTLEDLGLWIQADIEIAVEQAALQQEEVAATSSINLAVVSHIGTQVSKIVRLLLEELRQPRVRTPALALVLDDGHNELALGYWEVPLAHITENAASGAGDGTMLRIEVFNPMADSVVDVLESGGQLLVSVLLVRESETPSNSVCVQFSIGDQSRGLIVNDTEPQHFILSFRPNLPITLRLR